MIVIAHRGSNREAPENSFEAFEHALLNGADRIEIDVHLSRDKNLLVIHDESIERTTNASSGRIANLTLDEILQYRLKNNEPIPLLKDVLHRYSAQLILNVEIKSDNEDVSTHCAKLVRELKIHDRVVFSSFHPQQIEQLQMSAPEMTRAFLWGDYTEKVAPAYRWNPETFMTKSETHIIHPEAHLVDNQFMDMARRNHWQVYPWFPMQTEKSEEVKLWKKLVQLKVQGICTNYPFELRSWLEHQQE